MKIGSIWTMHAFPQHSSISGRFSHAHLLVPHIHDESCNKYSMKAFCSKLTLLNYMYMCLQILQDIAVATSTYRILYLTLIHSSHCIQYITQLFHLSSPLSKGTFG